MSQKPRLTDEQKQHILREVEEHGLAVTCRKHKVYAKSIYQWRVKFRDVDHVDDSKRVTEDPELRRLRQENQQLKEVVAEKELIIRVKDALLKKSTSRGRQG